MEIHNRFKNVSTTAVPLLLDSQSCNYETVIQDLVVKYNERIRNGVSDLHTLEAFRTILCWEYQRLFDVPTNTTKEDYQKIWSKKENIDLDIKSFFARGNESWDKKDLTVLYDILLLQLVVYGSPKSLTKLFNEFYKAHQESLASSSETQHLCMRVSESFADSQNLYYKLFELRNHSDDQEKLCSEILIVIKTWMKQEDNIEWKLLALLLPKLATAFGSDKIVPSLWDEVFSKPDELGTALSVLCVMADACFPCKKETVKEIHLEQCMQKRFWLIIIQGLICGISQHRKQSLYLMKRAVDFMESHESSIRKKLEPSRESIVPFMCRRLPSADPSIEQAKKSFFLILEALEEKQKHLVLPALTNLSNLVKSYTDHKICGDCFDVIWLHCILQRIMQHDNDAIKKFGLDITLQADLHIFDEPFLIFVANVLNNTFLYDCQRNHDSDPQIVKLLQLFFQRSEATGVNLINTFVRAISKVSWSPVALFWVLKALKEVEFNQAVVHNVWTPEELKCIRTLVDKNLTKHCLQLRICSQRFILSAFSKYAVIPLKKSNLELVLDTLCFFPEDEALSPHSVWSVVSDYLAKSVEPSDAALYVARMCDTSFTTKHDTRSCARIIGLLVDSSLICATKMCPAEKALRNVFQNLIGADLRPYADPDSILRILELLGHLINLASQHISEGMDTIKRLVTPYGDAIIKILSRSLERKSIARCDEYLLAITALINSIYSADEAGLRDPWWSDMEKQLERFEDKCVHIIAHPNDFCRTQWSYAIKVLYLCREETFHRRQNFAKTYIPSLLQYFNSVMLAKDHAEEIKNQNVLPNSRIASDCFENVAKLVRQVITKSPLEMWPANVHWFRELRSLVETESEEVIESVAVVLYELLEKSPSLVIQDLDTVNFIIRESWRCVFQLKRTQVFFSAVTQITKVIVNSNFLKLDGAKEFAVECAHKMMEEGKRVPSLKRIFLTSVENLSPQEMSYFGESLIFCLLHGTVPRRDQRLEREAIVEAARIYDDERFSSLDFNVDTTTRAQSLLVLLRVIEFPEAEEVRSYVLRILLNLLKQNKNKRYFDNSHLHKMKHRVMQTLLMLSPILNESETRDLHDVMCDFLIAESNQPSVRLLQEWIIIRIHLTEPAMRDSIWNLFATASEKRPGSIVSLASIVFHVSHHLDTDDDTKRAYIAKAITHLLPNCMGQQFNVRLYSQAILVRIFGLLPADSAETKEYKRIVEGVQESLRRGNLMKNSLRVLDNFFFTDFDPIGDWHLQIIYYDLPRMTNVSDDEWISSSIFEGLYRFDKNEQWYFSVFGNERWTLAQAMMKSTKATGALSEETDPATDESLSDIQKKIVPWKSMVPFYDELSETAKATLSRRKMQTEDAGIIVLASLIDRPPNLGGLARTCEIFGAKELGIGSLRYAEDREFQTLSVSAEKWITITEVKPHLLQNYLLQKQSDGWKLVGAEQTANSTNLLEMKFDKKTILLLGNEKDGIPASLIPLLDTCVEIPQNGVVRSLNVHVTGAICIWQYAKQHIFT